MLRNSILGFTAVVLAIAAPAMTVGPAYTQPRLSTCPTGAEVSGSFTKWHTNYEMSQVQILLNGTQSVSGFQFGAMKFGNIHKSQVEYGAAQDVCPVRVEYSFVLVSNRGVRTPKTMGVNQTHYFYKNSFDEWIFKTSSN